MEYLSKQRYDEIAAELKYLIEVVYPQVRDDVAETSAQGDRSENAGYREARRKQAKTISRIRFLQKVLEHSRVIDPNALPKDRVCLLSTVEFTRQRFSAGCAVQPKTAASAVYSYRKPMSIIICYIVHITVI